MGTETRYLFETDFGNPQANKSQARIYNEEDLETARQEAAEILGRAGDQMGNNVHGAHAHFLRCTLEGNEEEALRHATPEMEQAIRSEFSCKMMTDAYALLGRRDDALRWLRRAIDFGFIHHPCLANDEPFLESLRGDPEFQGIMADLKPRWEAVVEWEVRSS